MTKKALVMGPSGAGYITKLAQLHLNYLVAQGIGEALMLGAKGGLDLAQLHDVFMNSCAQSYVVDAYIPRVLDGSYDPSFALGLARKDMRLVNDLGAHLGVDLELGQQVLSAYDDATDRYGFDAPHLSILKRIEEASGQPYVRLAIHDSKLPSTVGRATFSAAHGDSDSQNDPRLLCPAACADRR